MNELTSWILLVTIIVLGVSNTFFFLMHGYQIRINRIQKKINDELIKRLATLEHLS